LSSAGAIWSFEVDLPAPPDLLSQAIELAPYFVSALFTSAKSEKKLGKGDAAIACCIARPVVPIRRSSWRPSCVEASRRRATWSSCTQAYVQALFDQ